MFSFRVDFMLNVAPRSPTSKLASSSQIKIVLLKLVMYFGIMARSNSTVGFLIISFTCSTRRLRRTLSVPNMCTLSSSLLAGFLLRLAWLSFRLAFTNKCSLTFSFGGSSLVDFKSSDSFIIKLPKKFWSKSSLAGFSYS